PVVVARLYSATEQKLSETHSNGVTCSYVYDPLTLRLSGISIQGANGLLQSLHYQYDPVGNVLRVSDMAGQIRTWRNQRVEPKSEYGYDSQYQLISATGREMANAGRQQSRSAPASLPLPSNDEYTNYTRTYDYDTAGNLTQIRHSALATSNCHTTNITVSDRSNRGVVDLLTDCPAEVDRLFSAGGYQQLLQPGQKLYWTPSGELQRVTPVVRDGAPSDQEFYLYDAHKQRTQKTSEQGHSRQQVIYLPGLELRTTTVKPAIEESTHVINTTNNGNLCVYHRTTGLTDDAERTHYRFNYQDLTNNHSLELDDTGSLISLEEYYPYGSTAIWSTSQSTNVHFKTLRFSGKERDATGLYYFGHRYYQTWAGRWLSPDPAGTVDGLNIFSMVRNNPSSYIDAEGFMQQPPEPNRPQYTIQSTGLHTFTDPAKRAMIINALDQALDTLNYVTSLNPQELPVDLMESFFGPDHLTVTADVVRAWTTTKNVLTDYADPPRGHGKFSSATSTNPAAMAVVFRADFQQPVLIFDEFFSDKTTDQQRSSVLIHEITHVRRAPKIRTIGMGSEDYFYLIDEHPREDSRNIVYDGNLTDEDLTLGTELFNAIAKLQHLNIIDVNTDTLTHGSSEDPEEMHRIDAIEEFNENSTLRARVAANNADSLAYAATLIAARRPQHNSQ
ncbi:RHS repeat-associated core domain-containing protein, partial [Pseudomonas sp. NPDC089752]|uniref:RHS repeat-associated core domain-containing protein n=1 Tax=Pseudomonas sp. NPDC089752 TaxID=3364472 RepID=UPI00380EE07D